MYPVDFKHEKFGTLVYLLKTNDQMTKEQLKQLLALIEEKEEYENLSMSEKVRLKSIFSDKFRDRQELKNYTSKSRWEIEYIRDDSDEIRLSFEQKSLQEIYDYSYRPRLTNKEKKIIKEMLIGTDFYEVLMDYEKDQLKKRLKPYVPRQAQYY